MNTKKHKRGDVRADGMMFWAYNPSYTGQNGERWITPEKFADMKRAHLANALKRYKANPAVRISAKKRANAWKKRNPEKNAKINKLWASKNPEKVAVIWAKRRERVKRQFTQIERNQIRVIYAFCQRVSKCIGIPFHVDHIVPLAKNGMHSIENLQVIPGKINQRKGVKLNWKAA